MKVSLKVKKENTVETIQHEVNPISLQQMENSLVVINDIFKIADEDPRLKELVQEAMEASQQEDNDNAEAGFIQKLIGAFDVLLLKIPQKAFELLSILSDVDIQTLRQQEALDVFDIYDAVIEVNDIEKLVKRAKKSLAVTKAKGAVMNLFKKKETKEMAAQQ